MIKLFIDIENDNLVDGVELPNGKKIVLGENCDNYSELEEFIGQDIEIFYSNGSTEKGNIDNVGYTENCEPFFSFNVYNVDTEDEKNE